MPSTRKNRNKATAKGAAKKAGRQKSNPRTRATSSNSTSIRNRASSSGREDGRVTRSRSRTSEAHGSSSAAAKAARPQSGSRGETAPSCDRKDGRVTRSQSKTSDRDGSTGSGSVTSAPKGRLTAYAAFVQIKTANMVFSRSEYAAYVRTLSDKWKNMTEDEKRRFQKKADEANQTGRRASD